MNKETLIFWIGEHNSLRGKGGTKGAMAARVVFNTRLEKTIDEFRKYFNPYIYKTDGDFLGFYRYEQDNDPTLIYCKK